MSISAKPLVASALLMGVTAVWVPRLTGYDPFGWLPENRPIPSPGITDVHDELPIDPVDPTDDPAPEPAGSADTLPLGSLREVVSFLETRSEAEQPASTARTTNDIVPVPQEMAQYVAEIEALVAPEPTEPVIEGPTLREELEAFLAINPLHTVIDGNGLKTATFGYQRVQEGDELMNGAVEVVLIDQSGVALSTPEGPMMVRLPPRGAAAYGQRQPARSEESQIDEIED